VREKGALEGEAASSAAGSLAADEDPNLQAAEASNQGTHLSKQTNTNRADNLIVGGAWLIALSLVILAAYLAWQSRSPYDSANAMNGPVLPGPVDLSPEAAEMQASLAAAVSGTGEVVGVPQAELSQEILPPFTHLAVVESISRRSDLHTIIPTRPRDDVITYTVTAGDSVFSIAKMFNIKPETVLWANYAVLKDAPDTLSIGMELFIPPVDGVLHTWKEGDSFESVASTYKATAGDILYWPGNDLDLVEPQVETGRLVMVPGGQREFVQWIVPTIARGRAGVSKSVYGAGACEGSYDGAYGSGTFVWPSGNRVLSGNDFWSGHLAIDIATGVGDGIFATDSGVIVFAGWAYGGYGNMVMIDHGNGYQSVYAHLSSVSARCGQSVYQGGYIGASGSTGNSTGPHLHFEIRYMGGFINPWHVLP
jgi:murein DD-endopeptidase MepM/ murein hydrolase activator NlpD